MQGQRLHDKGVFLLSLSSVAKLDALEFVLSFLWTRRIAENATMQLARTMPWTKERKEVLWICVLQPVESLDCVFQIMLRRIQIAIKRMHVFC